VENGVRMWHGGAYGSTKKGKRV